MVSQKCKAVKWSIEKIIRTQVEGGRDYVSDYFIEVTKGIQSGVCIEVKDFANSETRLTLLKVNDRTIATVIETRTEFNHVEFIFSKL